MGGGGGWVTVGHALLQQFRESCPGLGPLQGQDGSSQQGQKYPNSAP